MKAIIFFLSVFIYWCNSSAKETELRGKAKHNNIFMTKHTSHWIHCRFLAARRKKNQTNIDRLILGSSVPFFISFKYVFVCRAGLSISFQCSFCLVWFILPSTSRFRLTSYGFYFVFIDILVLWIQSMKRYEFGRFDSWFLNHLNIDTNQLI